jgi:hypothetical protein
LKNYSRWFKSIWIQIHWNAIKYYLFLKHTF